MHIYINIYIHPAAQLVVLIFLVVSQQECFKDQLRKPQVWPERPVRLVLPSCHNPARGAANLARTEQRCVSVDGRLRVTKVPDCQVAAWRWPAGLSIRWRWRRSMSSGWCHKYSARGWHGWLDNQLITIFVACHQPALQDDDSVV